MEFTDIKINDYVRFNKDLKYLYFKLDNDFLWINESLKCVLAVRKVESEGTLVLECVDDCGTHSKLDFTEDEYNKICAQLGADFINSSNFSEAWEENKKEEVLKPYALSVADNMLLVTKFLDSMV